MTGPFGTVEEYLERVAMSTVELVSADDRDARGVVVTVESGTARCERAFLREFLFRIAEDAVDSEVGGTGHGSFCAPAYSGLLQRQPDQVPYLIEPVPGLVPRPVAVEVEWHAFALPVPDGIDAETWAEYGDTRVDMPAPPRWAAGAFREFYLSSHGWDPPGLISIDDILTTHVNEAATTIVVRSPAGEPLAVGCLYEDDGELTLSGGPTDPTDPRADSAIATLLDAAPRPLLVEVDDSVPAQRHAVDHRRAVLVDEVHIVAES